MTCFYYRRRYRHWLSISNLFLKKLKWKDVSARTTSLITSTFTFSLTNISILYFKTKTKSFAVVWKIFEKVLEACDVSNIVLVYFPMDLAKCFRSLLTEAYSEPRQTSNMELSAVNYFLKKLHLRCFTRFWIHLWVIILKSICTSLLPSKHLPVHLNQQNKKMKKCENGKKVEKGVKYVQR